MAAPAGNPDPTVPVGQSPIPDTPSTESERLRAFYRRRIRSIVDRWRPHGVRLHALRALSDSGGLLRLRRKARTWSAQYGSVAGSWIRARNASAERGVILHLHGGGFVFGSPRSHRILAYQLSRNSGMPVFVPHYRRAPKYPFPAAADDSLAVYRELLESGIPPERIHVSGDSAGGHLAAGLLADASRAGLPLPAALVLLSPLLDLGCGHLEELDAANPDPFLAPAVTQRSCEAYLDGIGPDEPRADVLSAVMTGWPPTLIQVGDTECLGRDSERMASALRAAGVPCELQVWPGQIHVFQVWTNLPEARAANHYIGQFLAGAIPEPS